MAIIPIGLNLLALVCNVCGSGVRVALGEGLPLLSGGKHHTPERVLCYTLWQGRKE